MGFDALDAITWLVGNAVAPARNRTPLSTPADRAGTRATNPAQPHHPASAALPACPEPPTSADR